MPKPADLNRCLAPLDQDHTIIAVIEMSQSSWLVAGVVPGIARPEAPFLPISSLLGWPGRIGPALPHGGERGGEVLGDTAGQARMHADGGI
jgi:hypothetical protein